LLSVNFGLWAWMYSWRRKKNANSGLVAEELESFLAHLPEVSKNEK
jgi:hypothetical protein